MKAWSAPYKKWLDALAWDRAVQQVVFAEYRQSLEEIWQRVTRFEREIETLAQTTAHAPTIAALQAIRGVKLITAVALAELDEFRFGNVDVKGVDGRLPCISGTSARMLFTIGPGLRILKVRTA